MTRTNRSRRAPARRPQPTPRRPSTLVIAGIIAGVVIVAAIVALVLTTSTPSGVPEPARDPIAIEGTPLPALEDPAVDAAVGQQLPTLTGIGVDGEPMTIGPGDGPMVIVVLAHWCPHCQAELPVLVDVLEREGVPEGVTVVGLSTSISAVRANYPPSAWLEREGWLKPTLIDDADSSALQALGITAFPGLVAVDGDGAVLGRLTGGIGGDQFSAILADLAP
jgi:thiol-disulfide isomerase/thioredoxin